MMTEEAIVRGSSLSREPSRGCSFGLVSSTSSNGQEQFEFWGQLVFGLESVGEVNSTDSAISVNLDSEGFDVVGTVSTSGEVGEIELNLVPAFVESHGHGTDERLNTGSGLIVGGAESSADVLVIEHLHFESEVFFELTVKRELDEKSALTFLIIMTKKGSLMVSTYLALIGQQM